MDTRSTAPSCSRSRPGIGYCNITKCCTEVCPEHIHITDNAIIPLKERMADEYFDPLRAVIRLFTKRLEECGYVVSVCASSTRQGREESHAAHRSRVRHLAECG